MFIIDKLFKHGIINTEVVIMVRVEEYDKVKLKSGEMARISDILESGVAYIADVFKKDADFGVVIEQISHEDIDSVYKEIKYSLKEAI